MKLTSKRRTELQQRINRLKKEFYAEIENFKNMKKETKEFNGKAIYQPKGKAGEYAEWACNFYVGCSNGCEYCYLKKGRGASILGGNTPTIKKCFLGSTEFALFCFKSELNKNKEELQKNGLFFSFTTDPLLQETEYLTWTCAGIAVDNNIPVKILTKCASWVNDWLWFLEHSNSDNAKREWRKMYAIGFTLTGHDELEPNASTNAERIQAMKELHNAGFKTFASIEPIIDIKSSCEMIDASKDYCDLYKVGLMAGVKYNSFELLQMVNYLAVIEPKVYIKESIRKVLGHYIEPGDNFVERDYNMFLP